MDIGFIDHLYTPLGNTNKYNTIANFHTTNHSTLSSQSVYTSRCLVTALNNGYSSAGTKQRLVKAEGKSIGNEI
jgi:hypothetical protein